MTTEDDEAKKLQAEKKREKHREYMRKKRQDPEYRERERKKRAAKSGSEPNMPEEKVERQREAKEVQAAKKREKNKEWMKRKRNDSEYREKEREQENVAKKRKREEPDYREREKGQDKASKSTKRENPDYREREREQYKASRSTKRENPEYRERERRQENQRNAAEQAQAENNRPNFSTVTLNDECNFDGFQHDPELSVMLWHANSGMTRYDDLGDLDEVSNREKFLRMLKSEMLTLEEQDSLLQDFLRQHGRTNVDASGFADCSILACGACGRKDAQRNGIDYKKYELSKLDAFILTDEDFLEYLIHYDSPPLMLSLDGTSSLQAVHTYKARSIWFEGGVLSDESVCYNLHPELVDYDSKHGKYYTYFCKTCGNTWEDHQTFNDLSIAAGIDFGDYQRLGLTKPNAFERAIISKIRHYYHIIKIQSNNIKTDYSRNALKGHSIMFKHDAPQKAASLLEDWDVSNFSDYLKLHFFSRTCNIDRLIQRTLGTSTILARAYVVHQWLSVLKKINVLHENDTVPDLEDLNGKIKIINDKLIEQAMRTTNEQVVKHEHSVGDDVAQVCSCTTEKKV